MNVSTELCYICGEVSQFIIVDQATLLREANCKSCNASMRNSDAARIVMKRAIGREIPLAHGLGSLAESSVRILEAQASGPIHERLKNVPNYTCFEYFDGVEPGEYQDGIMSNDLEQLSFEDDSFDIVISQDVFEHIENPDKAFAEINRVLKLGGYHVFTIPLHEASKTKSRKNARPVFHGDALREIGALVYTDWGNDISEITEHFGMNTEQTMLHRFYEPSEITNVDNSYKEYLALAPLMYYRYNSIVFSSQKKSKFQPNPESEKLLRLVQFGPNEIVEGIPFNIQATGDSAIWALAENATKSTIIKIDDIALHSNCNEQDNVITAVVPSWIYKFAGEHKLYLFDEQTKRKSNSLPFIVKPTMNHLTNPDHEQLKREYYELAKEHYNQGSGEQRTFEGWGMATNHQLPWNDQYNWSVFRESSKEIKKVFNFGLKADTGVHVGNIDILLWRHWIVAFALNHSLEFHDYKGTKMNLVECGVGDGMSAFFALKEIQSFVSKQPDREFMMHLYDSWDSIQSKALADTESFLEGRYTGNSLERVRGNLADFESNVTYHEGYIPDTLKETWPNIVYLHIDLNSAKATLDALKYFYPSLASGSVILFDDYGWLGYSETKEVIDLFFSDKPGTLLKLPTGQAIYFYK